MNLSMAVARTSQTELSWKAKAKIGMRGGADDYRKARTSRTSVGGAARLASSTVGPIGLS